MTTITQPHPTVAPASRHPASPFTSSQVPGPHGYPQAFAPAAGPPFPGTMLGNAESMRRLYHLIARVAPTTATVLLVGESGTGKELAAHAIHQRSRRRHHRFVAVNCGAIPENLIESELFGHEKGAFTGAGRTRKGVFERATGGTLFLDEVTEMPPPLQVRLLRVLETGCITRVGSEEEIPVDVRVIAATNRDPVDAVADAHLRKDLLYRLSVFPIHLPPLRQRGDDVELLAQHFLAQHNQIEGCRKQFAPQTLDRLRAHTWPGNVRELRNAVLRAFILADAIIEPCHLPPTHGGAASATPPHVPSDDASGVLTVTPGTPIADVEKRLIQATLDHFDGDKKRTAETLGISLKTLYNRLNAYHT